MSRLGRDRLAPPPFSDEWAEWNRWLSSVYTFLTPLFLERTFDAAVTVPSAKPTNYYDMQLTYETVQTMFYTWNPANSTVPSLLVPTFYYSDPLGPNHYLTLTYLNLTAGNITVAANTTFTGYVLDSTSNDPTRGKYAAPPSHVEEFDRTWRRWIAKMYAQTSRVISYEYSVPSDIVVAAGVFTTHTPTTIELAATENPISVAYGLNSTRPVAVILNNAHRTYGSNTITFVLHNPTGSSKTILAGTKLTFTVLNNTTN